MSQAFDRAGWQVVAHVRRAAAPGMPARARLLRAPLAELDAARLRAEGRAPSVVVHGINLIYTRWNEEAMPALRQGIALAEALGARLMLPGNVYNHGEAMPAVLDERTPMRPTNEKGRIRVAMEDALAERADAGTLRATVITAGDFFGAGTGGWFDQAVAKPMARGRIDYPGDPRLMHAWAYLPDLAEAFVAVASQAHAPAFQRLMFGGHSVTGSAFVAALERAAAGLGMQPARGWRHGRLPWWALRAVGVVVPLWRELARMAYLRRVPHAIDGRRLEALAGPLRATPLDEALRRSLRELGYGRAEPQWAGAGSKPSGCQA
ncbi:MAG TPA: epimerase [Methylibium sp.]|uniref:epimerase n=1 Tax=Methylibium sp. TaxID=2067992 RepID=UPI002DBA8384|nr:epimerase [Methylibium sp.]HEU4460111.1 epimerase [Methylibium sp.]